MFILIPEYAIVWIQDKLSVYSIADNHLDVFQVGAIMSSAALTVSCFSFDKHECTFAQYIPRMGTAGL